MKRNTMLGVLFCATNLLNVMVAHASEKPTLLQRDPIRLAEVNQIALVPTVIELRFDRDKRIPDPNRMAARLNAVQRVPSSSRKS